MLIDIFLLLLIQLPLLHHLQFSSGFSSSTNAPPPNSYRPPATFQRTSLSTFFTSPLTFPPHSPPTSPTAPPHLTLGVHFSSPRPTCQILSCLSRSIRPQIVLHLFYLVSLTHTSISNLKSYTCMNSHRSTNCSDCCLTTTINSTFHQGLNLCQQDLPKCRTSHIPV